MRLRTLKLCLMLALALLFLSPVNAQYEAEGWRFKLQTGLWFGPVTPFPGSALAEVLDTNLGGGMFFRFNLPYDWLRSEVGISYAAYTSKGPEVLRSVPYYYALTYKIPLNLPLTFQAKLGGGANYFRAEPEFKQNTHPALLIGTEASFPAGKWVNIGVKIDYYFAYEKYLSAPPERPGFKVINGHFLNFGLMVNFNVFK